MAIMRKKQDNLPKLPNIKYKLIKRDVCVFAPTCWMSTQCTNRLFQSPFEYLQCYIHLETKWNVKYFVSKTLTHFTYFHIPPPKPLLVSLVKIGHHRLHQSVAPGCKLVSYSRLTTILVPSHDR